MFTEQVGRVSFICRIAKTAKGKIKKQYFQPLSILDMEFDYRMNSKLQYIKDVRIAEPFASIPFDSFKLAISFFISEFLYYSTCEEQQNKQLFRYIVNSVLWLDAAQHDFYSFHLVFMMHLSLFLGLLPNTDNYQEGDFFDLRDGRFVAIVPLHSDYLSSSESSLIQTLLRLNYETMNLCKLSHIERNRCAEVLLYYYRLHIPNFQILKSFDVLKTLFS